MSLKVLVVDDEPFVRSVCEAVIRRVGYEPISAVNGEEGLSIFRNRSRDIGLVLSDLSMPKLNGLEMALKIFELEPSAKVILMTGYQPELMIPPGFLGLCATIAKPFTIQVLGEAIQSVCRMNRQEVEVQNSADRSYQAIQNPLSRLHPVAV